MKRRLLAHLLLSGAILLALAACERSIPAGPIPAPGPIPDPPVGGGMPAELVGEWYSGSPTSSGFYDPATGSWGSPSGSGFSYTFRADGSYQEGYLGQVRSGSCYTGFFIFIEGVARVRATNLTKTRSRGVLRVEDTCSSSLNEERGLSGEELAEHQGRYNWRIRTDGANTQQHLDITLPDGNPYVTLRRDGPLGSSRQPGEAWLGERSHPAVLNRCCTDTNRQLSRRSVASRRNSERSSNDLSRAAV